MYSELLFEARKQDRFSGLQDLLQLFCKLSHADGVVLWRPCRPGVDPNRYLFAAASYFTATESHPPSWNSAIFHEHGEFSPPVEIAKKREPSVVHIDETAISGPNRIQEIQLIRHFNMESSYCIPLWRESHNDKWFGALRFYRCGPGSTFTFKPSTIETCQQLASLFLPLYDTLMEAVGYKFLRWVDSTLDEYRVKNTDKLSMRKLNQQIQEVSSTLEVKLRYVFSTRETAIFLENDAIRDRRVERKAQCWPWKTREEPASYLPGEGIPGYCFQLNEVINIADLLSMTTPLHSQYWQNLYPGISTNPPFTKDQAITEGHPRDIAGNIAPLSVIAVPIRGMTNSIGVLQCVAKTEAPFHLSSQEGLFLEKAALRLGEWASLRLDRARHESEQRRSHVSVAAMQDLATLIDSGRGRNQSERLIELAQKAVPHASWWLYREFSSIADSKHKLVIRSLRANTGSAPPPEVQSPSQQAWTSYRFDLQREVDTESSRPISAICPISPHQSLRSILAIPVFRQQQLIGVLELQGVHQSCFVCSDARICLQIVNLFEMCKLVEDRVLQVRQANESERQTIENYWKATRHLAHQMRTPSSTVNRVARNMLAKIESGSANPESIKTYADQIYSISGRAVSVTRRMQIFVELATTNQITSVSLGLVNMSHISESLKQVARMVTIEKAEEKRIEIRIEDRCDEPVADFEFKTDSLLLAQVFEILIENAVKFGDLGSTVDVIWRITRLKQLTVSVWNKGICLGQDRLKQVRKTMEQMDGGAHANIRGHGCGLFIANAILNALGGTLEPRPTDSNGLTEFRIQIPLSKHINPD